VTSDVPVLYGLFEKGKGTAIALLVRDKALTEVLAMGVE